MEASLIPPDVRQKLREEFEILKRGIKIYVFTKEGENDQFNLFSIKLVQELSQLSGKIEAKFYKISEPESEKYRVTRSPTILIDPENYNIRYIGAPAGEEGRSFIESILMASLGISVLSNQSREKLAKLEGKRHIMVFASPTCPYCPQQVVYAVAAAIERRDLISVEVVDIFENEDLAREYNVLSVPQTAINGKIISIGLESEDAFIEEVLTLVPQKIAQPAAEEEEVSEVDLIIVGAGPAGLTAAIYAERSGLKTLVLEKANIGGQAAITPIVENYPGFTRIPGKTLMDMMAHHAMHYTRIHQGEEVLAIKPGERFEVITNKRKYLARGIILATGAVHRKLNVLGEDRLYGRGVSYCATCDGYLYRGKKVLVIGGGNSAVTEALYLDSIGANVTLVHRGDKLRAEAKLQQLLSERKIPVIFNSEVREIIGEEVLTGVKIENKMDKKVLEYQVDGIFISIGHEPANELAKQLGLKLDGEGYIEVDRHQRTSMPFVYAAGDVTGGVRQIVTAVGEGSVAALTAFEDLSSPYWKKK
ncbi:MAG: thioredoxin-disulfide reductase [Methanocellales archaeon]